MNPEKSELIANKIAKSRAILDEVDILIENNLWNTSVNRLYYACFHAVTALLAKDDIHSKTHSGSQQIFALQYVKTGIIDRDLGKFYSTLFTMRQKSDYEDSVEYDKDDVLSLLEPAKVLVDTIESILMKTQ